jgi:hypothetical protein
VLLTTGEQLQDPAANRVTEHVERMHPATLVATTYISKG